MEAIWAEILAQAEGGSEGDNTQDAGNGNAEHKSGETGTKEDSNKVGDQNNKKQGPCYMDKNFLFLMLAMFAIMYFIMIRPQKKRQQEQQKMLQEITKNTRVRTIGGIIGTVVDTREDEVVLKIDEANNTKMRIVRSAIGKVLTEEEQQEPKKG